MALFQTEGWNLNNEVRIGGESNKKLKNNKKRKNQDINKDDIFKLNEQDNELNIKNKKQKKVLNPEINNNNNNNNNIKEINQELSIKSKLTPLQQKMMTKLTGSRFRWINEQLYTIKSEDALKLIKDQPSLFDEYHEGFKSQVQSWPENPIDIFINQIKERSKKNINSPGGLPGFIKNKKIIIADMGCGKAKFSFEISKFLEKFNKKKFKTSKLNIEVHSFDLKKVNDRITVADIKNVPLENNSCNIVIFCLALMGTNFLDFINEAYRILAPRGELWIAEIKSRFIEKDGKGEEFVNTLKLQGFFHKKTNSDNKMFIRFEFFKAPIEIINERNDKLKRKKKFIEQENEKDQLKLKRQKLPEGKWLLKPCIYKRR